MLRPSPEVAHLLQKAAIGSTLVTSTSSSSAASAPAGQTDSRGVKSAKLLFTRGSMIFMNGNSGETKEEKQTVRLFNHSTNMC